MKEVKIYHLSPTGGLAEGEKLGCISVYLKSDYESLQEELSKQSYKAELYDEVWQKATGMGFMNVTMALEPAAALREELKAEQRLTAAEQRNADTIAKLELAASMMDDDERGNRFAEVCRLAIKSLKPTESGASE